MKRTAVALAFALLPVAFPLPVSAAGRPHAILTPRDGIVLELVGQFANGTAPPSNVSLQYGYLTSLHGISRLFKGQPHDESTALYTFYTVAVNTNRFVDGWLQIVVRRGTTTLYHHPGAHATFADPDSFRRGTPIQVSTLHQQVVRDTVSRTFSTTYLNTVTKVRTFTLGGRAVQFGRVGDRFRTSLIGHFVAPGEGPPCGDIAGYAVELTGTAHPGRYQDASVAQPSSLIPLVKYPC